MREGGREGGRGEGRKGGGGEGGREEESLLGRILHLLARGAGQAEVRSLGCLVCAIGSKVK